MANAPGRTLTRIDRVSGRVVKVVELAFPPTRVAAGDGAVWVSHEATGNVSKVDARTGDIVATVNVGNGPGALSVDPDAVWVANNLDGTVSDRSEDRCRSRDDPRRSRADRHRL